MLENRPQGAQLLRGLSEDEKQVPHHMEVGVGELLVQFSGLTYCIFDLSQNLSTASGFAADH